MTVVEAEAETMKTHQIKTVRLAGLPSGNIITVESSISGMTEDTFPRVYLSLKYYSFIFILRVCVGARRRAEQRARESFNG